AGLKISARSDDDGVIEGIEFAGAHFILGVQWHPERLLTAESHQLFTCFTRACQEMTDRKGCS
ncbi:MAG TPA: peptidase C26, partial [Firmicutes bacterium]|nr:peptidase C26 [Bacillota bacterium]